MTKVGILCENDKDNLLFRSEKVFGKEILGESLIVFSLNEQTNFCQMTESKQKQDRFGGKSVTKQALFGGKSVLKACLFGRKSVVIQRNIQFKRKTEKIIHREKTKKNKLEDNFIKDCLKLQNTLMKSNLFCTIRSNPFF